MHFRRAVNVLAIILIVAASARLLMPESSASSGHAPPPALNARTAPTLRVYDLRDLWPRVAAEVELRETPNHASSHIPKLNFGMGQQEVFSGPPSAAPKPTAQEMAMWHLGHMLKNYSNRDEWVDDGGSIATSYDTSGFIAVWHTPQGHRQIEELLAAIRQADRMDWKKSDGGVSK